MEFQSQFQFQFQAYQPPQTLTTPSAGMPKGVMLSHRNLANQLFIPSVQARAHVTKAGKAAPSAFRTLAYLLVAHTAGVFGYLISPMFSGGACVLGKMVCGTVRGTFTGFV
jgi:long-subunit acyl-CoA synthetase (AMP-forming)